MIKTCFGAPSIYNFFLEKHQILNFWWYIKVCQANCLSANFGTFGQSWANFAALLVAMSMPKLWLKS
jgi:hypothetical protein